jgi:hypothetical protein
MDDQREFFDPKLANSILDSDYGAGNQSRRDKTPSSKTGLMSSTTALSAENF